VISFGDNRSSIEIVRCHFDEGRIVLLRDGELHVLHEGDELDSIDLRVMSLTADHATILIRPSDSTRGLRIIRITTTDTGKPVLREIATDPATLSSGPDATGNPMSSVDRTAKPVDPRGAG